MAQKKYVSQDAPDKAVHTFTQPVAVYVKITYRFIYGLIVSGGNNIWNLPFRILGHLKSYVIYSDTPDKPLILLCFGTGCF